MTNITSFNVNKRINGELITLIKYIDIETGQLVDENIVNNCNFITSESGCANILKSSCDYDNGVTNNEFKITCLKNKFEVINL